MTKREKRLCVAAIEAQHSKAIALIRDLRNFGVSDRLLNEAVEKLNDGYQMAISATQLAEEAEQEV